jgi:S-DNA-T family DNA segregation ATPase FtsK/SpoIIIE
MSRVAFHRQARITRPVVPEQRIPLAPPPELLVSNTTMTWLFVLISVVSSVIVAAFVVIYGRPWTVALGIVVAALSTAGAYAVRRHTGNTDRRTRALRRDRYDAYLRDIRRQARVTAAQQRFASAFSHPSPDRLLAIASERRRVWERRPTDDDFLKVRIGVGRSPLALRIEQATHTDPMVEYDPSAKRTAEELVHTHATVGLQPVLLDLGRSGVVSLLGPADRTRALAGALLSQLAVLHAPDDVVVAVSANGEPAWQWAKWLPHLIDPEADSAQDVVPLIAERFDGIADHLERRLAQETQPDHARLGGRQGRGPRARLVVVLDGYRPDADWARTSVAARLLSQAGPESGITVICLVGRESEEPERVDVRVRIDERGALALTSRDPALRSVVENAVADRAGARLCEQIARRLAPLRMSVDREKVLARTISVSELMGCGDLATLDPRTRWRTADDDAVLRVPVGVTGDGEDLTLDLKESAQGGIGPHGLVVGATGSGKSELLRTLVTGLTMQHSPELLSFVLIDFKGGATFAGVTELPHVAGLITNLADDLALVDRVWAALHGEQQRRQRLLRDAGNLDSLRDYQVRRAAGGTDVYGRPLEPLPYLLIVADEFGELLTRRPDFIDVFQQIGRLGRSLGMHLLLATHRLDDELLRGLESHLSYRICLRTFSAAESLAVLGTPDAYRLPPIPGSAYLKVDESVYERFRVAHVSGAYRPPGGDDTTAPHLLPFTLRTPHQGDEPGPVRAASTSSTHPAPGERTEMQVAIEHLRMYGAPVRRVWLPPLPDQITLNSVLGPVSVEGSSRGLQATMWPQGQLNFPIGVVDLPVQQTQYPLVLDLAGPHGHVALVGAPQTGKSTALRTALIAAMLTHTPRELRFYCVDRGGGSLQSLQGAPHVSGVAGRHDPQRTRDMFSEVLQLIGTRERLFEQLGITTIAEFRKLRDDGGLPDRIGEPDVVVVIDNWGAVRKADDGAEEQVLDISSRGLGVGVHLILTANRWREIGTGLRDNIGGRVELWLNEPGESEVNGPAAGGLPAVRPGRGIAPPGLVFQTALPRLDGIPATENLATAVDALITEIASSWPGEGTPPEEILPTLVSVSDLEAARPQAEASVGTPVGPPALSEVPIGLREPDLAAVGVDLSADDPHLLVVGDPGAGKTSFLRAWMRGLARRQTAWDVRFVVVDYRRSLLGVVPDAYIGAHAGDAESAAAYVDQLLDKLDERLPPAGISPQDLRERTWWTGPELYLVVDDYDLVANAGTRGPLAPVTSYLPQARELGFHVVLARHVGGFARALRTDPLISGLRELGSGLVLSADQDEGALIGDQIGVRRPPGRGVLVRRGRPADVVQTVWEEDGDPANATAAVDGAAGGAEQDQESRFETGAAAITRPSLSSMRTLPDIRVPLPEPEPVPAPALVPAPAGRMPDLTGRTPGPAMVPTYRSTEGERTAFRAMIGLDWDSQAAPVRRAFSRLPALGAGERAAAAVDLVAVRLYLTAQIDDFGPAALRSGDEGLRPYLACLASGLRRLPTYRGVVARGVDTLKVADLRAGMVLTDPGPVGGVSFAGVGADDRASLYGWPPTTAVYVIWSDTARRVAALLDADAAATRNDVVFGPGSRFVVLDVRQGDAETPDIVLLREFTEPTGGDADRSGSGAAQAVSLALARLDGALAAFRSGPAGTGSSPWPAYALGPIGG